MKTKGYPYPLYIKYFLIGVIFSEVCLIVKTLIMVCILTQPKLLLWILGFLYTISILLLICISSKNCFKKIKIIINSLRFDLFVALFSGAILCFIFNGAGTTYIGNWFYYISQNRKIALIFIPIIFMILLPLKNMVFYFQFKNRNSNESSYMSDNELLNSEEDAFGFSDKADNFARRVYDNGSSESLVFGVDAPWGTGKTTFINFCKKYWMKNKNIIIYDFNPLRFEKKDNIWEKFVKGLIGAIRQQVFAPDLGLLISSYYKLIRNSRATLSIFNLKLDLPFSDNTFDDISKKIETALKCTNKKIIVIIDDLDRLSLNSIREILFVIKKGFNLSNVSYVLCYDIDNISKLEKSENNSDKICEFLEKFINIKISLYLDSELLLRYFTVNLKETLKSNLDVDPIILAKATEGLKYIFNSKDYYKYLPLIGDARKLKRLINIMITLGIDKTDFDNCDFDKKDLINLLLIYINYPTIFRKIYNTETHGKRGFFSVVSKNDEGYQQSKNEIANNQDFNNSVFYTDFLKTVTDNQKFILNELFDVNIRFPSFYMLTKNMISSYACFNNTIDSKSCGNLEQYLNLIISMSYPQTIQQQNLYVNIMQDIINDKFNIEIMDRHSLEKYFYEKSIIVEHKLTFIEWQSIHKLFWNALINGDHKFYSLDKSIEIISYAVQVINKYSLLPIKDISFDFRSNFPFYIVKLFEQINLNFVNTSDNCITDIAKWIFGEEKYKDIGIIRLFCQEEKGILGFYDLLTFRLYCCINRGQCMNLANSLLKHKNSNVSSEGSTDSFTINEMREMSQIIYSLFRTNYIDKKKNVFLEIAKLSIFDVCGDCYELNADSSIEALSSLKTNMIGFTIYQLGSACIDNEIGCGYYDINGIEDKKGIQKDFSDYIFDVCFNPSIDYNNYYYFFDFIIIAVCSFLVRAPSASVFNINTVCVFLDKDRLISYWKEQSENIKSQNFLDSNRKVQFQNFIAPYSDYIKPIFDMLDGLLD